MLTVSHLLSKEVPAVLQDLSEFFFFKYWASKLCALRTTETRLSISAQEEGENWAKVTVHQVCSFSSDFMWSLGKGYYRLGLKLVSKNRHSLYSIKLLFFVNFISIYALYCWTKIDIEFLFFFFKSKISSLWIDEKSNKIKSTLRIYIHFQKILCRKELMFCI